MLSPKIKKIVKKFLNKKKNIKNKKKKII